jgi:hypothetical protein
MIIYLRDNDMPLKTSKKVCVCFFSLLLLCTFFNASLFATQLNKSKKIQEFDIQIDKNVISSLKRSPTSFDFADYEIDVLKKTWTCTFEIWRKVISNGDKHHLGRGDLTIVDGDVKIGDNYWKTGGMASPAYLTNEANLKLTTQGNIVGKMPYFHLFINDGEVALPPVYVTLNQQKLTGRATNPIGAHVFFVDDWQQGLFLVKSCT